MNNQDAINVINRKIIDSAARAADLIRQANEEQNHLTDLQAEKNQITNRVPAATVTVPRGSAIYVYPVDGEDG